MDPDDPSKILVPQIFCGVAVYITGRTGQFSSYDLGKILNLHGGVVRPFFSKTHVTHLVAQNLPGAKIDKVVRADGGARGNYTVVHPDWIVKSVDAGRRLPESDFAVVDCMSVECCLLCCHDDSLSH